MAWVGYQEGMAGVAVSEAKKVLKRKFSYAKGLDDGPLFTGEFKRVLEEFQRRKNVELARAGEKLIAQDRIGVLDWYTQKLLGILPAERVVIFTVNGTLGAWNAGYPFDIAMRQNPERVIVQPIGYPALIFPMGQSVAAGEAELVNQMRRHLDANPSYGFVLSGWSQGAMVCSRVLKRMLYGDLTRYLDRCLAGVMFGNPYREKGKFVGVHDPGGQGLDPYPLVGTPPWWYEYSAPGDIYSNGPGDDDVQALEHMRSIYRAVQGEFVGVDSVSEQVLEILLNPAAEVPPLVKAIVSGIGFVSHNPPTAPHVEYHIRECVPGQTYFEHACEYVRRVVEAGRRIS